MSEGWQLRLLALLGLIAAVVVAVCSQGPESTSVREQAERADKPRAAPERSPQRGHAWRWPPLVETPRISGRIVDLSSGPLSEGRIDLYCVGSTYHVSTAVGEEGELEAPACPSGPTCVRLIHPGVQQPRGWELEAGAEVELEVEAAPTLSGTILGPKGEIVPGAELLVHRGANRVALGSDAAGEFAVAFPRDRPCDRCDTDETNCRTESATPAIDRVQVFVSAPKLAPVEVDLPLDGDPVEIVLDPAAPALVGRVISADGEVFEGRTRVLASNRARELEGHAAEVDAEGRFSFEGLAVAEYSLRVLRDEREIATFALARPGEEIELRSELSARGSTLTVEIVGADDEPIVGARVDGGPWRSAISDADGRVEAGAVLPGIYTVRVRADDWEPRRETIELEPGAAAWLRRVKLVESR